MTYDNTMYHKSYDLLCNIMYIIYYIAAKSKLYITYRNMFFITEHYGVAVQFVFMC